MSELLFDLFPGKRLVEFPKEYVLAGGALDTNHISVDTEKNYHYDSYVGDGFEVIFLNQTAYVEKIKLVSF